MKLLDILELRFKKHPHRHEGVTWDSVFQKINQDPKKLTILQKMEDSGGEIDIIAFEGKLYYVDFSKESPNRRSFCYDEKAWHDRKKFKPESSVEKDINNLGSKLVTEAMYLYMQTLEDFDLKTSSWIATPKSIRDLGGALNAEKRYGRAFIFHNGADSYYQSRGYRSYIEI